MRSLSARWEFNIICIISAVVFLLVEILLFNLFEGINFGQRVQAQSPLAIIILIIGSIVGLVIFLLLFYRKTLFGRKTNEKERLICPRSLKVVENEERICPICHHKL